LPHDLYIAILEDVISPNFDLAIAGLRAERWLTSEIDELSSEIALVLWDVLIQGGR